MYDFTKNVIVATIIYDGGMHFYFFNTATINSNVNSSGSDEHTKITIADIKELLLKILKDPDYYQ